MIYWKIQVLVTNLIIVEMLNQFLQVTNRIKFFKILRFKTIRILSQKTKLMGIKFLKTKAYSILIILDSTILLIKIRIRVQDLGLIKEVMVSKISENDSDN